VLLELNLWNIIKTQQYMSDNPMLENNSYYDIDIINKANKPIKRKIKQWEKKYAEASSWLGKWYCQIRIDKLKAKLYHYENKS
jgi:hypothetical protein